MLIDLRYSNYLYETLLLVIMVAVRTWLIIAIYTHNTSSCENKAWQKFRPERDSNPRSLWYRCSALWNELSRQLRAGHVFWIFSGFNFTTTQVLYNCDDQSYLHIFLRSSDIWSFIYSVAMEAVFIKTNIHNGTATMIPCKDVS